MDLQGRSILPKFVAPSVCIRRRRKTLLDKSSHSLSAQNPPLVSVVMATYNGMRYIPKQLDSLLAQTYPNIEIVISDDASTDGTPQLLQQYAEQHPNIRLLLHTDNVGYVKNFERGMLAAKGDLIAPSDQDDIWLSNKIERLVSLIGEEQIIYCNSELIDGNDVSLGRKLSDIKRFDNFDNCLNYTVGGSAPGHAMLVRRNVVQEAVPLPTMIPHDYWLGFVATFTTGLRFVDEVFIRYRQHNENVFGAVKLKDETGKKPKRRKTSKRVQRDQARERMRLIYEKCPEHLVEQKQVFKTLNKAYQSFSLANNWRRMVTFFRYRHEIMAYKRRNEFRKWLYCFKMFFAIR